MNTYTDAFPPPAHALTHGCVSEISDRVLETTFFISWSPESELEALSLALPLPLVLDLTVFFLLRWSKKMQANSHPLYFIDVKEKTECSYGGVVDAASATATKATYHLITVFQKWSKSRQQHPKGRLVNLCPMSGLQMEISCIVTIFLYFFK